MKLACKPQLGRSSVAARSKRKLAKSLISQHYGPRSSVAPWRSSVPAKSLKFQHLGRSAVGPLPKGREGGPMGGLLPHFLISLRSPSQGDQ